MAYIRFVIQRQNPETEEWTDYCYCHAIQVNKDVGKESFSAGSDQLHIRLWFDVRWSHVIEEVAYNSQEFQIVYRGRTFNIIDHDDYMEQHRVIRLLGESYG